MLALLAHPVLEAEALPVSPLVLATAAVCLIAVVARVGPAGVGDPVSGRVEPDRVAEPLPTTRWPSRALAVALLAVAIVAGRIGRDSTVENLAPALVMGLAWPLLVAASLALGRVWAWLDPWDTLARLLAPLRGGPTTRETAALAPSEPIPVWGALPAALAWVWLLGVSASPFSPRTVGTALTVYTVVTVAGTLLVGRRAWLRRAEVFGLLFDWLARLRRGRLRTWEPPAGVEAVLGALAGGLLFSSLRGSVAWLELAASPRPEVWRALALLACVALAVGLLALAARAATRFGARGSAAAGAVPVVGAVALATALTADRLKISAQLLPGLVSDPLGRGWDLFGTAHVTPVWEPTELPALIAIQVGVLLAGGVVGALVARRRTASWRHAGPAVAGVCALVAGGVLAVSIV